MKFCSDCCMQSFRDFTDLQKPGEMPRDWWMHVCVDNVKQSYHYHSILLASILHNRMTCALSALRYKFQK